ncbi:MAG: hypothetical protein GY696_40695 [Gammaproteobacteria bacterium]|nr:hypothetical protein [Gammaproteobacteria bacterium]
MAEVVTTDAKPLYTYWEDERMDYNAIRLPGRLSDQLQCYPEWPLLLCLRPTRVQAA